MSCNDERSLYLTQSSNFLEVEDENYNDNDAFDEDSENLQTRNALAFLKQQQQMQRHSQQFNGSLSPGITSHTTTINTAAISDKSFMSPMSDLYPDEEENSVFDHENFIEEVKKYPCLWNTKLGSYKEQPKKKLAWQNILIELNDPSINSKLKHLTFDNQCFIYCF